MPIPIARPSSPPTTTSSVSNQNTQPTPIDPTGPQPAIIPLPPSTHTTVPPPTSTTENPSSTTSPSASSADPSSLPPAALDLAAQLFDLARSGNTPRLHAYITAGIPPNLTNHAGDTLLMLASYHGHLSTARMLLDAGADVNAINNRGQSILAGVVFKGFEEVAGLLLERGADKEAGQPSARDCAYLFRRRGVIRMMGERVPDEDVEEEGKEGEGQAEGNGGAPTQREWA